MAFGIDVTDFLTAVGACLGTPPEYIVDPIGVAPTEDVGLTVVCLPPSALLNVDSSIAMPISLSIASHARALDFASLFGGNKFPRPTLCFSLPEVSLPPATGVAVIHLSRPLWFNPLLSGTDRSLGAVPLSCVVHYNERRYFGAGLRVPFLYLLMLFRCRSIT